MENEKEQKLIDKITEMLKGITVRDAIVILYKAVENIKAKTTV